MGFGHQLERAEMFSFDSEGREIPRPGDDCMRVRPCRPTPPATASRDEEQKALVTSCLSELELRIWNQRNEMLSYRDVQKTISDEDWPRYEAQGWLLVKLVKGHPRRVIRDRWADDHMGLYERIGQALGLTARQVERHVVRANRKIKARLADK